MRRVHGGLVLVLGLGLGACEGATGPADDAGDVNLAVATVAAEATVDDVQSLALGTWGLPTPAPSDPGVPGQPHGPGGGLAADDVLERSRTLTFFDEAGAEMDGYDPLLTERIRLVIDVEGSLERPRWSGELERHRDVSVTGLAGAETERTWDGTGSDAHRRVRLDDDGSRERRFESETAIESVVVGVPRSEYPWPLSGTITRHVEVSIVGGPAGDVVRERTVVVTFDGTRYASLTVNGETFEVDLADRTGQRPRRRGPR